MGVSSGVAGGGLSAVAQPVDLAHDTDGAEKAPEHEGRRGRHRGRGEEPLQCGGE